ncbi:MAG: hypothetical protein JWR72_2132 [Flavisolibacter sp.]|nr:hypothetical protein [Flavisolibacter sp.]
MKNTRFEILPTTVLEAYCSAVDDTLLKRYEQLEESELSVNTFSF